MRAFKLKTDSVCFTELPAFAFPRTSKKHNRLTKKLTPFLIFFLVPENIDFEVGQHKMFWFLLPSGTSKEKYFEFHKSLKYFGVLKTAEHSGQFS